MVAFLVRITGKPVVIPGEKFALPVIWVRGIKLRLFAFPRSRPRTIVSPLGSGVAGPFSYSLFFAKIKRRGVQNRGVSKNTLSPLHGQATRVVFSGFLPSTPLESKKA